MEYLTRVFPTQTGIFDLKDASSADLVKRVLQAEQAFPDLQQAARAGASLNMTYLALSLSKYVNGVAKQHGETSRQMFPGVPIEAITNGVHAGTWTSPAFRRALRSLHSDVARRQLQSARRAGTCRRKKCGRRT